MKKITLLKNQLFFKLFNQLFRDIIFADLQTKYTCHFEVKL